MRLADQIRHYVYEEYIQPARVHGKFTVDLRARDIHKEMELHNRMPADC